MGYLEQSEVMPKLVLENEKLQEANVMFLSELEIFLPAMMRSYLSGKPIEHDVYIRAKSFHEDIEWAKNNQNTER